MERKLRRDENSESPSPSPIGLGVEITNHHGGNIKVLLPYFQPDVPSFAIPTE
jgi:hypothetical protein